MRIVVHAQHLSGVGHHVRAVALARALATAHDVVLVDGGAPRDVGPALDGLAADVPVVALALGPRAYDAPGGAAALIAAVTAAAR